MARAARMPVMDKIRPVWFSKKDWDDLWLTDLDHNADEHALNGLSVTTCASALWAAGDWIRYHPDPKIRALADVLQGWLLDGRGVSLERTLGLRRHGGSSVHEAIKLELRRKILKHIRRSDPKLRAMTVNMAATNLFADYAKFRRNQRFGLPVDAEPSRSFAELDRAEIFLTSQSQIRSDLE